VSRKFQRLDGHVLRAVSDPPDTRDFPYEPALIKLKRGIKPQAKALVLDQGRSAACAGFALATVINELNRRRARRYGVSPRMLYEMARRNDEWPGENYDGSSCRGAIKGWHSMGVCREAEWPWSDGAAGELTVKRAKAARENTLGVYYRVAPELSHFHAALNEVGVLFVSANLHRGWHGNQIVEGKIPLRRGSLGGHAFAVVGYDAAGFWVQNSWGDDWGRQGLAHWRYEDWQQNILDAWVFRLGLPSPQIWYLPPNPRSRLLREQGQRVGSPPRAEIAGHFAHFDDGHLHAKGKYWSNLNDVRETAQLIAAGDRYRHLLLYAHGGLNAPDASARRISAMKEVFKANGIYPYHLMYDTGLMEELKDIVSRRDDSARERVGGFTDWTDRIVERATRRAGRALWREMKAGAQSLFAAGGDGAAVSDRFLAELSGRRVPIKIHVAGHSTGGILLAHLVDALAARAPTLRIASCHLLAPAATVDLFQSHFAPYLQAPRGQFGIDRMTVYNLTDAEERADNVAAVYRKSLLYLVSRSYEEVTSAPLLGMQLYSRALEGAAPPGRLEFVYSGASERSRAASHGAFDNDLATLNDLLAGVLGKAAGVPFRDDDLDY
jgi:hypothetical protein